MSGPRVGNIPKTTTRSQAAPSCGQQSPAGTGLWTNSSPLPFRHRLPCTEQGWCSPRTGNDFVASHKVGGKGLRVLDQPHAHQETGAAGALPSGAWESSRDGDVAAPGPQQSATEVSGLSATLPGPGERPRPVVQVLPAERPRWLHWCRCRIHPGPLGTTRPANPRAETTQWLCKSCGCRPGPANILAGVKAERGPGRWLSSQDTGQHGKCRAGQIQHREPSR